MPLYPSLAIGLFLVVVVVASGSPNDDGVSVIEQHPHVAAVEYLNGYLGGASIISRYFVLTHRETFLTEASDKHDDGFFDHGFLSVRTGSDYARKNGSVHTVCHIAFMHDIDVALLQLAEPITFDRARQPIRLYLGKVEAGARVRLSAWGDLKGGNVDGGTRLRIFEGILKDKCSVQEPVAGRWCVERPSGLEYRGARGHAVVIDGWQVGVVGASNNELTHISDVSATTARDVMMTMMNMSFDKRCPADLSRINGIE